MVCYDREVKVVLDVAVPTVKAPNVWKSKFTGEGLADADEAIKYAVSLKNGKSK